MSTAEAAVVVSRKFTTLAAPVAFTKFTLPLMELASLVKAVFQFESRSCCPVKKPVTPPNPVATRLFQSMVPVLLV